MSIFNKLSLWFLYVYRALKFGFQRLFRGFTSQDVYALNKSFISRYMLILKQFKEHNDATLYDLTKEEWDAVLDCLVYHLRMMDEENVIEVLTKDMPEDFNPSWESVTEIMNRNKKEFFELFSKYFYDLWY
jgi:uncharacterized protein YihD (DUF1040 family)